MDVKAEIEKDTATVIVTHDKTFWQRLFRRKARVTKLVRVDNCWKLVDCRGNLTDIPASEMLEIASIFTMLRDQSSFLGAGSIFEKP